MLSPDQFYLHDPPTHIQQGDICAGVPLLLYPASPELILIRSTHRRQQLEHLESGPVDLVRELAVPDAFDGTHEYVAVAAERSLAMLMSPTCDIEDLPALSVWPIYAVEGSDPAVIRALESPNHPTLLRLPDHRHFPASFIDVTDYRSIGREHFQLKNRVASITKDAQNEVVERFIKGQGRQWGYAPGETVPPSGKYETGKYRCARCNSYDVSPSEVELRPGGLFPICEQCRKIHKTAQWYPVTKHRKS